MAILATTIKGSLFFLVPIFKRPLICCLIFYKLINVHKLRCVNANTEGHPTKLKLVLKEVQEIRKYNRYSITFYPSSSALSNSIFFFKIDPLKKMYILNLENMAFFRT